VDTGADISAVPKAVTSHRKMQDFKLYAANGTPINTYGDKLFVLNLGLCRPFAWRFIIAKVSKPIIGADFLRHFNLFVDLKKRRLVNGKTQYFAINKVSALRVPALYTINANNRCLALLKEFVDVTKPRPFKKLKLQVFHHIITKGPPVAEKARRLPLEN